METPILARIDQPADLKQLSLPELTQLASELRHVLLNKVSQTGGHVGPNLGVVELTIAFHTIFNSPVDKVVWDVSHQSYTHKILTGRKQAWLDPAHYNDVSGYTAPEESPHDYFNIGHTSTSIALATGMAVARDLEGKTGNVMAVIGDGSLSGGLALEGLNIAATLKSNLIILVNDNGMAIAEDHGGIYQNLRELRETNGTSSHNLFKDFGLDYRYVDDGNDLETMLTTFKEIKDVDHPIVLHVHTEKGHGYQPAITNKEAFHWHVPFDLATGQTLHPNTKETYTDVIHATLADELAAKTPITAITAAVPGTYDLKRFARQYPDRTLTSALPNKNRLHLLPDRPNKAYGQSSSILVPSCNGPMINYSMILASINCPLRSWLPVAALTQAIQLIKVSLTLPCSVIFLT